LKPSALIGAGTTTQFNVSFSIRESSAGEPLYATTFLLFSGAQIEKLQSEITCVRDS